MDNIFRREHLGTFHIDLEYELYVEAWMAYHKAADRIDGDYPCASVTPPEILKLAIKSGLYAMESILNNANCSKPDLYNRKWQSAKLEALRRIK